MKYTNGGTYLVVGGDDGLIRIFNSQNQNMELKFFVNETGIFSLHIDQHDTKIACVGLDNKIYLIDLKSRKNLITQEFFDACKKIELLNGVDSESLTEK